MLEDNIKSLIKILEESKVDELEVSTFWGKQKIRICKNTSSPSSKDIDPIQDTSTLLANNSSDQVEIVQAESEQIMPMPESEEVEPSDGEKTVTIKAPLVGTYYALPKPGDPPFINQGDTIKEGQIICIIEAMKIFNEIESEISGKVLKMLIKNGTPVEYDQDLIVIAPE